MSEKFQNYIGLEETKIKNETDAFLESIKRKGFFLKESLFTDYEIDTLRLKIDEIWEKQVKEFGHEFLVSINEIGSVRCMMSYEKLFLDLVRDPKIFNFIEAAIGDTAILHLQNGIILSPSANHNQSQYHKDFPKNFVSDSLLSLNSLIVIDEFNQETGGTFYIEGSHIFKEKPSDLYIEQNEIQINAKPGDVLFFDSMLWHKGGSNKTNKPRRAINQQYTKPFIKQQISYPDLMQGKVDIDTPLAQTLGMWTIPPKSLLEYRVDDSSKRTYRGGQG